MALYTRGLGAIEQTAYGRIFKYASVKDSFFEDHCTQYRDQKHFLDKIEMKTRELRYMIKSYRETYDFFLNQKRSVGTPKYVYSGEEANLETNLKQAKDELVQAYTRLSGLVRLRQEVVADMKGQTGPITVCFYKNSWVEAHERMHALLTLSSGFSIMARSGDHTQFNTAIKFFLQSLGPKSQLYEGMMVRGLRDRITTYEELLAGIAGIAQIVMDVRDGKKTKEAAQEELNDALANFESYLVSWKLDAVPLFRERRLHYREAEGSEPYFLAIADFYYGAASEFLQKYQGNLEKAASDFARFYRMLA